MSRTRVVQLTDDEASAFVKFADAGADEFAAASVVGSGHRVWISAELQLAGIAAALAALPGQVWASLKAWL